MTPPPPPTRYGVFVDLLQYGIAALHLDARVDGVRVPPWLRDRAWLVLNFSYGYRIDDFRIEDEGVGASLSFSGRPYPCWVPWSAVFAVTDDGRTRQWMWTDAMPPEERARALPGEVLAALPRGAIIEQSDEGVTLHIDDAPAPQAIAAMPAPAPATASGPAPEPAAGARRGVGAARRGLQLVRGGSDDAVAAAHRREEATGVADDEPPPEPPTPPSTAASAATPVPAKAPARAHLRRIK